MPEMRIFHLGDITRNFDAQRIPVKAADRQSGPYPYYGASGIVDFVDEYLFDGEYLLIAEDGENLRTRKTPIAFMASGKFWVNNHAHIVRGNHNANTRYLCYVLAHTDISGYLSGSTQPKLTKTAMNQIAVSLPVRSYQDGVVEILKALDDKIAVNNRIAATSRDVLKAFSQSVTIKKSRHIALREIIDLRYGKALKASDRIPGRVPVFGGNGISGRHNRALVSGSGIIIGRKGANAGSVSWSNGDFWPIDTAFYVMAKDLDLPMEFLFLLLQTVPFRGEVGDSAIPGLNREIALSIKVWMPGKEEARKLAQQAHPHFKVQEQIEEENRVLAELRDVLLPKLMSGEVRIKDAEKVVEDAV